MKRSTFAFALVVSGCKLLHRNAAETDAATSTPIDTTAVAATTPTDPAALDPLATASASAMPSASTSASNADAERIAARNKAIEEAREFGMLGLIGAIDAGDLGPGGYGPSGGLGRIGTFGDGGSGHDSPTHFGSHTPSLRMGNISVNGRLPPEVIQRIIRQSFGRFRLCYEAGLRSNPQLQGRVAVKFTILRDGGVSDAKDGGSDMPDQGVTQCVVRAFDALSYPQPEGGIVTVVAPIIFSPPP